jgi:hypothetical protein
MYLGYPNTPFLSCRPPLRYGLLARDRRLELGHCKRRTGVEPAKHDAAYGVLEPFLASQRGITLNPSPLTTARERSKPVPTAIQLSVTDHAVAYTEVVPARLTAAARNAAAESRN